MHADHQLAWAAHGVLTISRDADGWVLPSSRALWIPAGVPHEVRASGRAVMRTGPVSARRCRCSRRANPSGGSRCGPAT